MQSSLIQMFRVVPFCFTGRSNFIAIAVTLLVVTQIASAQDGRDYVDDEDQRRLADIKFSIDAAEPAN